MGYLRAKCTNRILTLFTVCMLAWSSIGWAEEEKESRWGDCETPQAVIKELRYMNPWKVPMILSAFDHLSVRVVEEPAAVVITSCPGRIEAALEILTNLDEPPAPLVEVEVVMYVLEVRREGKGDAVPAALESVVGQLEGLFGYRNFALLDTLFIRTMDRGAGAVTGTLDGTTSLEGEPTTYSLGFNRAEVFERESGFSVRLSGLEFQSSNAGIRTDVEVKEGQKAVVGKAKPNQQDEAWILVLEVKVLP